MTMLSVRYEISLHMPSAKHTELSWVVTLHIHYTDIHVQKSSIDFLLFSSQVSMQVQHST